MKTTLKDGFEVEVIDESLNDWELLEMLNAIDEGDSGNVVKVARLLLGKPEYERLKNHYRVDGRVSANGMITAIGELLESIGELKNS